MSRVAARTVSLPLLVLGAGVLVFYLFPIVYLLNVSLETPRQFLVGALSFVHSLDVANFVLAWKEATLGAYFGNSVLYTSAATLLAVTFAVFLAFPVSRQYVKGHSLVYQMIILGFFLPIGIIPLFIEAQALGLYNNRLGYILLHI